MAKSNSDQAKVVEQRREHWLRVLRRWRASGLSQAEFCRRQAIPVWKLGWWKGRLKGQVEDSASLFVPVGIATRGVRIAPAAAASASVELALSLQGGRVLRFPAEVESARLAEIVAALEKVPPAAAEGSPC